MFTFQVVLSSMRQNNTSYFVEYSFSDLLKKNLFIVCCLLLQMKKFLKMESGDASRQVLKKS